eukprot:178561-Prorocentrum_minimum.AAC.4
MVASTRSTNARRGLQIVAGYVFEDYNATFQPRQSSTAHFSLWSSSLKLSAEDVALSQARACTVSTSTRRPISPMGA